MFNTKLTSIPVASVQASSPIALIVGYIIDPRNLTISALYAQLSSAKSESLRILHTTDIREFTQHGIIINNDDQLMDQDDLVRLQEIIDIDFKLLQKPVVTEDGSRIGKVSSFVIDTGTWLIVKLHVRQPIVHSVNASELIVARSQIVKVTDSQIIIKSANIKAKAPVFSLRRLFFGGTKPALNPDTSPTKN